MGEYGGNQESTQVRLMGSLLPADSCMVPRQRFPNRVQDMSLHGCQQLDSSTQGCTQATVILQARALQSRMQDDHIRGSCCQSSEEAHSLCIQAGCHGLIWLATAFQELLS